MAVSHQRYPEGNEFTGFVVHGRKVGRTIGFPTANIQVNQPMNLVKGVYGVQVYLKNRMYYGIMNVGTRPSFNKRDKELSYEVHIFDFNQIIYSENISVSVQFFVRTEKAFASVEELTTQITQDARKVKDYFSCLSSETQNHLKYG